MKKICKLAILLSIILTFNACKKDTVLQEVKNTDPTEQKILNFKAQMQNPNKSNESMSIDSAVWYIEAALNYTYCRYSEERVDVKLNSITVDSIIINYEDNNSQISLVEITTIYDNIKETFISDYNNLTDPIKFYDFVDVNYKENKFITNYAFVSQTNVSEKTLIMWSSAPQYIYAIASIIIPAPPGGYFTDIDYLLRMPYWDFATNGNPYGDYLLFYSKLPINSPESYLNDAQMYYYSHSAPEALTFAKNDIPKGYTYKNWELDAMGWLYGDGWEHRAHYIKVFYGILH